MKQEQSWHNCEWFDNKEFCPPNKNNNELMRNFISDISGRLTPDTYSKKTSNYKNEEEISKLCKDCNSFKNRYIKE
jgi:hypothetical protein